MYELKFDENLCGTCPTFDCLVKCQYINADRDEAHKEMIKIIRGEDSFVLHDCVTCYACEEYCKRGNHPFYLISERREEKGIFTAARAITNQWYNIGIPTKSAEVGNITERVLSFCFMRDFIELTKGKLFEDIALSYVLGTQFMCPVLHLHFAKASTIKERLPQLVENYKRLNVKQVICMHDECYGALSALAPAYGIEVPFEPIHYLEFLYNRLEELRSEIKPLNIRAVYQRPCSSRLSPDRYHFVGDIMEVIGVEVVKREYQGENALCCGEIPRMINLPEVANDIQKRNIDDMVKSGAEYCFFNCPACQDALGEKVAKRGIKPIHIIDLAKMAISER